MALWYTKDLEENNGYRLPRFLKELEAAGGQMREDILNLVLANGWTSVFKNKKPTPNNKTHDGEPISAIIHAKGNPNAGFDLKNFETQATFGKRGGNAAQKELAFAVCWLAVSYLGQNVNDEDLIDHIEETMTSYLGMIVSTASLSKRKEEIEKAGGADLVKNLRMARLWLSKYPKASASDGFKIHRGSKLVNALRSRGRKVSNVKKEDRWNPADVYLIKDSAKSKVEALLSLDDEEFNTEFNKLVNSGNFFPISLKEMDNAIMGSAALSQYSKVMIPISEPFKDSDIEKFLKLAEQCQRIAAKEGFEAVFSLNKKVRNIQSGKDAKSVEEFLWAAKEDIANNLSYRKCYPPILQWFVDSDKTGSLVSDLGFISAFVNGVTNKTTDHFLLKPSTCNLNSLGYIDAKIHMVVFEVNSTSMYVIGELEFSDTPNMRFTTQMRTKGDNMMANSISVNKSNIERPIPIRSKK